MQISSLSGLYQAGFCLETERTEKRNQPLSSGERRGDTVSFSEEALALARNMVARTQAGAESEDAKKDSEGYGKGLAGEQGSGMVLNGARADEKDIYAQIQRTQEEVNELTAELEQIMGTEAPLEEKLRLSEPTQKQLKDKLELLSSLKGMAEAAKMNKAAADSAKNPFAQA